MKVIGIDPGISATGYGILEQSTCICTGTIRSRKKNYDKVLDICNTLRKLIDEHKPTIAALEKVFYHKNIQSLIRSSEVRGAIILTLLECRLQITEYAPTQIKLTTTGNGRASKEQVRYMIERIIGGNRAQVSSHATDALAVAYTALQKTDRGL